MSSPGEMTEADPLDLTSLDSDSLFQALTAVERAIPTLLLHTKPILANLSHPAPLRSVSSRDAVEEEQRGIRAREAVEQYMNLLDKIQFVLRQTVYYLHETRVSPNTLRPPPVDAVPTPFASTLPDASQEPELGLYGRRIEAGTLKEMTEVLRRMKRDDEVQESEQLPPSSDQGDG
ncbi:hypothetical protein BCR39DRAFT_590765 [Naematelia encephala]|uniref:Mediator of RNA polymerase II transcription subunit 11 n=1 Tax=Naematelia encephala TaxID=71784 RepID=A0A1Y2ANA6_9TREE|nr:hypothetical protein BCR39DRAFT_590765 [Naematelia encephala]